MKGTEKKNILLFVVFVVCVFVGFLFFLFCSSVLSLGFSSFLKPAEVEGGPPPPDCCAIKDTWKNEFDLIQFKHFAIQFNIIAVPLEISVTKVNFVS